MAVGLASTEIEPFFSKLEGKFGRCKVQIACFNSPTNLTCSGDGCQIDALKEYLDHKGIFAQKLRVNVAYHTSDMLKIAPEYLGCLQNLELGHPTKQKATMISTVTGSIVESSDLRAAQYWVSNLVSPVKFSEALAVVCSQSKRKIPKIGEKRSGGIPQIHYLLEVGPHSALKGPIRESLQALPKPIEIGYESVLARGICTAKTFLGALGALFCAGVAIDFKELNLQRQETLQRKPKLLIDLPEYPFDHSQRFWIHSRLDHGYRMREHRRSELLGRSVLDWNPFDASWRNFLRPSELPWIDHHKVRHQNTLYSS